MSSYYYKIKFYNQENEEQIEFPLTSDFDELCEILYKSKELLKDALVDGLQITIER